MPHASISPRLLPHSLSSSFQAVTSGVLLDRVFRRRMKAAIVLGLTLCLAATVWFAMLAGDWLPSTEALLIVAISMNGFFKDTTSPLFYELAAEVCVDACALWIHRALLCQWARLHLVFLSPSHISLRSSWCTPSRQKRTRQACSCAC